METKKQTIKITIPAVMQDDELNFAIDGKIIAEVGRDFSNKGKFRGCFGVFGSCNNTDFPDAVEFISSCIELHFAQMNIGVEFEAE